MSTQEDEEVMTIPKVHLLNNTIYKWIPMPDEKDLELVSVFQKTLEKKEESLHLSVKNTLLKIKSFENPTEMTLNDW